MCVFKFVCNCAITPSIPNLEDKFFLELLDPFMDADGFRTLPQGRRHAQPIDVVHNDFVVSVSLQISSRRAETSLNFSSIQSQDLCHLGLLSVQGLSTV